MIRVTGARFTSHLFVSAVICLWFSPWKHFPICLCWVTSGGLRSQDAVTVFFAANSKILIKDMKSVSGSVSGAVPKYSLGSRVRLTPRIWYILFFIYIILCYLLLLWLLFLFHLAESHFLSGFLCVRIMSVFSGCLTLLFFTSSNLNWVSTRLQLFSCFKSSNLQTSRLCLSAWTLNSGSFFFFFIVTNFCTSKKTWSAEKCFLLLQQF